MQVSPNDLESRRFGVRFARLEASHDPAALADALRAADRDAIDVVSTRVDASDLGLVRALEDAGFRIMDTLVYHRRPLPFDRSAGTAAPSRAIVNLTPADAGVCAALAARAFSNYLGHYHADPRLSNDAADAAYADWIARLLTAPAEGQIALGVRAGGDVAGFIAGRSQPDGAHEIVLNAVAPEAQRGGLYTALLHACLDRAAAAGSREAIISTQLQNYGVQRAWSRAGFLLYRSFHTLHRWSPTS